MPGSDMLTWSLLLVLSACGLSRLQPGAAQSFPLGEAFCQGSVSPFSAALAPSGAAGGAAGRTRCWDVTYTPLPAATCAGSCCDHDISSFVLQANGSCAGGFAATAQLLSGGRVTYEGRAVMRESPAAVVVRDFRELSGPLSGPTSLCITLDDVATAPACDWRALMSGGDAGTTAAGLGAGVGAGALPWTLALVDSTEQCCPVFTAPEAGGSGGGTAQSCKQRGGHRLWWALDGGSRAGWSFFGDDTSGTRCRVAQGFAEGVLDTLHEILADAGIDASIDAIVGSMSCKDDSTFEVCLNQTGGADQLDMGQLAVYLSRVQDQPGRLDTAGGVYGVADACPLALADKGTPTVDLEDEKGNVLFVGRATSACAPTELASAFPFCSCGVQANTQFYADPLMTLLADSNSYCLNLRVRDASTADPSCTSALDKVDFLVTELDKRGRLRAVSIMLNGTLLEMRPQLWRVHEARDGQQGAVLSVVLGWAPEYVEQNSPQLCFTLSEGSMSDLSPQELAYALHSGPSCCPRDGASYYG
ncbi:hypothetical protein CHLRE_04g222600v5 [Chlamydomonas reinhardtii]|uniref:Pherophorin domain-containing protein n=1 Tax=Chlamydomonas reinhardtii TaxID=3055 RepID=A0A2K3DUC4_CHLRE|nr:uncharacterized protein CHLRE_04g222600v5 [Chlamydomonas reinhardtii]PNW84138.1 hypothetical protein CHLRE_04g222600v5 [Chlamydomonas reinhardtii]